MLTTTPSRLSSDCIFFVATGGHRTDMPSVKERIQRSRRARDECDKLRRDGDETTALPCSIVRRRIISSGLLQEMGVSVDKVEEISALIAKSRACNSRADDTLLHHDDDDDDDVEPQGPHDVDAMFRVFETTKTSGRRSPSVCAHLIRERTRDGDDVCAQCGRCFASRGVETPWSNLRSDGESSGKKCPVQASIIKAANAQSSEQRRDATMRTMVEHWAWHFDICGDDVTTCQRTASRFFASGASSYQVAVAASVFQWLLGDISEDTRDLEQRMRCGMATDEIRGRVKPDASFRCPRCFALLHDAKTARYHCVKRAMTSS